MELIASPVLSHDAIRHGFFTRQGGVSQGIYASLNCGLGSNDDQGHVAENRHRVAKAMKLRLPAPITIHQQHTNAVAVVDGTWTPETRPVADGMVTRERGVGLGILTADCAPILFADTAAGVIGAAHAGWRGAHTGVLEHTVAAMIRLGARKEHIQAAIGPCIGQDAYQVGDEFVATFVKDDPASDRFFSGRDKDGRRHFDLTAYAAHRLVQVDIGAVDALRLDTCTDEDHFFSYRRTTHRKERDYGRQISVIALVP